MESYLKPSARIIMAVGRDLIKDNSAAVAELVKNSYDADANFVEITFAKTDQEIKIIVEDDGHGMSLDTVLNSWMVPATSYKLKRKKSPKGRTYQGRKGIGRYATSLLGEELELLTVQSKKKVVANFDWNKFDSDLELDQIPIEVNESLTNQKNKTRLTITNKKIFKEKEEEKEIDNIEIEEIDLVREPFSEEDALKIEKELKKILTTSNDFKIFVNYLDFFKDSKKNIRKEIEAFKSSEAFNYRLTGTVHSNLSYNFKYYNYYNKEEKTFKGTISRDNLVTKKLLGCGKLEIDYKVYDLDNEGLDLITSFLNDQVEGSTLSSREAKTLIQQNSGIGIYRNGFKIRPYGEIGFDWLSLDGKRVQNPSLRIGANQISGQIKIQSEEKSGLKEKSARDGLYENQYYNSLLYLAAMSLNILELERFEYRSTNRRNQKKIPAIEKLFDFSDFSSSITENIEKTVKKIDHNPENTHKFLNELNSDISKKMLDFEKEKTESLQEVKEEVAIYQKHATLGNVINVVLHEGRKPSSWFTHKIPKIQRDLRKIKKMPISEEALEIVNTVDIDTIKLKEEATRISRLFSKIDPLSNTRRKKAANMNVREKINDIVEIFSSYCEDTGIVLISTFNSDIESFQFVEEDFYMALTNILENSVFWTEKSLEPNKLIEISTDCSEDGLTVDIKNNGPSIKDDYIDNGKIFIPGFSAKEDVGETGTGLGLAIAGEALSRNNASLEAIKSINGAHFRIKLPIGVDTNEK